MFPWFVGWRWNGWIRGGVRYWFIGRGWRVNFIWLFFSFCPLYAGCLLQQKSQVDNHTSHLEEAPCISSFVDNADKKYRNKRLGYACNLSSLKKRCVIIAIGSIRASRSNHAEAFPQRWRSGSSLEKELCLILIIWHHAHVSYYFG